MEDGYSVLAQMGGLDDARGASEAGLRIQGDAHAMPSRGIRRIHPPAVTNGSPSSVKEFYSCRQGMRGRLFCGSTLTWF